MEKSVLWSSIFINFQGARHSNTGVGGASNSNGEDLPDFSYFTRAPAYLMGKGGQFPTLTENTVIFPIF